MEKLYKWSICNECLGCNQLENPNFKGIMSCSNFIRGTNGNKSRGQDNWKTKTKGKL